MRHIRYHVRPYDKNHSTALDDKMISFQIQMQIESYQMDGSFGMFSMR